MEVTKAEVADTNEVLDLARDCIRDMQANGIVQWNDQYPKLELFMKDIGAGTLFVMKQEGAIIGIIVLSEHQDREYSGIEWRDVDGRYLVVHRLAVSPHHQRRGVAKRLMEFAEDYGRGNGYSSIRLDTYYGNPRALALYDRLGYERRPGHINFPECEGPYYCFELLLGPKG